MEETLPSIESTQIFHTGNILSAINPPCITQNINAIKKERKKLHRETSQISNRIGLITKEGEITIGNVKKARKKVKQILHIKEDKLKYYKQKMEILESREQMKVELKKKLAAAKEKQKELTGKCVKKMASLCLETAREVRKEESKLLKIAKKKEEKLLKHKSLTAKKIKTEEEKANEARKKAEKIQERKLAKYLKKKIDQESKLRMKDAEKLNKLKEVELKFLEKAKNAQTTHERLIAKLIKTSKEKPSNYQIYMEKLQEMKTNLTSPKSLHSKTLNNKSELNE